MATNDLVCWEENSIKRWEMVKKSDSEVFLLNLLQDSCVDKHTIFIIPTSGLSGIWLWAQTHKSNRVNFFNFFEDFGAKYEKPKIKKDTEKVLKEVHKKRNTKYGWISPEGKYFPCDYGGHSSLAYDICFGMVETNNSERYLEENGWCKIFKPLFSEGYDVYVDKDHSITDQQLETLISMGLDKKKSVSEML
ncbi:hypothetical protein M2146_002524 [Lachnospiraceae bacterium PF1-22]